MEENISLAVLFEAFKMEHIDDLSEQTDVVDAEVVLDETFDILFHFPEAEEIDSPESRRQNRGCESDLESVNN